MYEIKSNPAFPGANEVYFDQKPVQAVIDALKALKMRWHNVKKCWYGYKSEMQIADAINAACEAAGEKGGVEGEGYLGGGAYYGSKSHKNLYGAELAAAIRADLKKAGIKGITVSKGHSSITLTAKATKADMIDEETFVSAYEIPTNCYWIETGEKSIHREEYWFTFDENQREETRIKAAHYAYRCIKGGLQYFPKCGDKNNALTAEFTEKLNKAKAIVLAYRWDESNSMVDYFSTNFYDEYRVKFEVEG